MGIVQRRGLSSGALRVVGDSLGSGRIRGATSLLAFRLLSRKFGVSAPKVGCVAPRLVFGVLVFFGLLASAGRCEAAEPERILPSEVLQHVARLRAAFQSGDGFECIIRENFDIVRASDGVTQPDEFWFRVRKHGTRWAILHKRKSKLWINSAFKDFEKVEEYVTDEQSLQILCREPSREGRGGGAESLEPATFDEGRYLVFGSLSGGPTFADHPFHTFLFAGKLIFGYADLGGTEFLPDILEGGGVTGKRVSSNSGTQGQLVQLESNGTYGKHTVWIDPAAGYLPTRIEVVKQGPHLFGGTKISSQKRRTRQWRIWPNQKLIRHRRRIENIVTQTVDDHPLIAGFTMTQVYEYDQGDSLTWTHRVAIQDVRTSLDWDDASLFQPTIEVPDGTRVQVNDSRNIDYIWSGGEIVLDPSLERAAARRRHRYLAKSRKWLVAVNIVALLVFGTIWAVRRKLRTKAGHN